MVWVFGWVLSGAAMVLVMQGALGFNHQHAVMQVQRRSLFAIQYLTGRLRMAGQLHCALGAPGLSPALRVYPQSSPPSFVRHAQSDVVVMQQCDPADASRVIKTAFFVADSQLIDQGSVPSSLYMQYQGGVRQALVPGVGKMDVRAYNARGVVVSDAKESIAGLAIHLSVCSDRGVWLATLKQPYCQRWHTFVVPRIR